MKRFEMGHTERDRLKMLNEAQQGVARRRAGEQLAITLRQLGRMPRRSREWVIEP